MQPESAKTNKNTHRVLAFKGHLPNTRSQMKMSNFLKRTFYTSLYLAARFINKVHSLHEPISLMQMIIAKRVFGSVLKCCYVTSYWLIVHSYKFKPCA